MTRFLRLALIALGSSAALSACDYKYSPGENTQFHHSFNNAPGWRNQDVNRDSINYKQRVTVPSGEGSATAIRNGSVQDQLNSAPGGKSATSPQSASGQLAAPDKTTNGNGNNNDQGSM